MHITIHHIQQQQQQRRQQQHQQQHHHQQRQLQQSSQHYYRAGANPDFGTYYQMNEQSDDIDDILSSLWPTSTTTATAATRAGEHRNSAPFSSYSHHCQYQLPLLPRQKDLAVLNTAHSSCYNGGKPPPLTSYGVNAPQWDSGQCTPPDDAKAATLLAATQPQPQQQQPFIQPAYSQPLTAAESSHIIDAGHFSSCGIATSSIDPVLQRSMPQPLPTSNASIAAGGNNYSVYAMNHGPDGNMPAAVDTGSGYVPTSGAQSSMSRSISSSIQIGDPEWRVDSPQSVKGTSSAAAAAATTTIASGGGCRVTSVFEQVSPQFHSSCNSGMQSDLAQQPCLPYQEQVSDDLPSPISPTAPNTVFQPKGQMGDEAKLAAQSAGYSSRSQPTTLGLENGSVGAPSNRSATTLGLLHGIPHSARTRPPTARHALTREERAARLHTVSGLAARAVARRCLSGQMPALDPEILLQGPLSASANYSRKLQVADHSVRVARKPTFADVARGTSEPAAKLATARPL
ncbi:hypothetical protein GGI12_003540 [Dipsacomyces acuminosporus]|nr:hypothetical protein GGI12_003540 [Dipsacomyces acuminosporus]